MSLSRRPPASSRTVPAAARSASATSAAPVILVVDDEPHIVDLLTLALTDEGYQVECAYDGEQAWNLVHEQPPDLIISDISMPRLDGLDLLRRLRRQRWLAQMPVILMSAARSTVDVRDVTFVPKPFDLDRMVSLVESELAGA